jgi:hypothetical protein
MKSLLHPALAHLNGWHYNKHRCWGVIHDVADPIETYFRFSELGSEHQYHSLR